MKHYYFVCALLLNLVSTNNLLNAACRNQADRFALSACHSIGGTIQFDTSLKTLPEIRIYCSGTRLSTEMDTSRNSIYFTAPKRSYQDTFPILITESIDFEMVDNQDDSNTIAYLKVPKNQKYKLYLAHLSPIERNENNKDTKELDPLEWIIEEKTLSIDSGRIPDNTIILMSNPDFVESVQAGNYRDLPLIKMRNDLVHFVGSEAKIHDLCNEILLGSIDIDTIHTTAKQEQCIKISHNKVLKAPSIL